MLLTVETNRVPRTGRRTIDRLVNRLSEPHKKPSAIGRAHMCHCQHRRSLSQLDILSRWCGKTERKTREKPKCQQGAD